MQLLPLLPSHLIAVAEQWPIERITLVPRLRWHLHTPYAHARCIMGTHLHGVIAAVRTGRSARITALRTLAHNATNDVHAQLVEDLRAQLAVHACHTLTATVPPAQVHHWRALGFRTEEQVVRYAGGRFIEASHDEVMPLEAQHRLALLHLDRRASGEDRSALLLENEYLGRVYMDGRHVRGFALPLLGEGLIVADAPMVGLELQRWLFPVQDHLLLPENSAAHAHLIEHGYRKEVVGVRMVHGPALVRNAAMIFAEAFGLV